MEQIFACATWAFLHSSNIFLLIIHFAKYLRWTCPVFKAPNFVLFYYLGNNAQGTITPAPKLPILEKLKIYHMVIWGKNNISSQMADFNPNQCPNAIISGAGGGRLIPLGFSSTEKARAGDGSSSSFQLRDFRIPKSETQERLDMKTTSTWPGSTGRECTGPPVWSRP